MARVNVTVDDAHLPVIDQVARALRASGMDVQQVLGATGTITGAVAEERRTSLRAVAGVVSVDDDVTYRLPPPGSPVQ